MFGASITESQREFHRAHKQRLGRIERPKTFCPAIRAAGMSADQWYSQAWSILRETVTIKSVQDEVCAYFDVPRLYMETTRRAQKYYLPRATAIYLTKQFTAHSYPVIGRHFGNRDHTTIMHSVKTVEKMIALGHPIKRDIEILTEKLRGATHD